MGIGILLLLSASFAAIKSELPISFIKEVSNNYLTIAAVVLIATGILISKKKTPTMENEPGVDVPIYKGKKIVGYRRH